MTRIRSENFRRDDLPLAQRELWQLTEVAAVLGCSASLLKQMDKEGLIPAGVVFGRHRKWRARQVRAWIDAGCPHPSNFVYKPVLLPTLDEHVTALRGERDRIEQELRERRGELQRLEDRARELRLSGATT